MSKLKKLEAKKLMKELEFVESDYDFKNEVVSEVDGEFLNSVTKFLENHPQLKEIFDKKINDKIDIMLKSKEEEIRIIEVSEASEPMIDEVIEEDIIEDDIEVVESPSNIKVKKLYREIVKLTHPDKVKNKKLNDYYIKATGFYDTFDLAGIYSICNDLSIDYDVDESDTTLISDKITRLKERIHFMESTFTWKWHYSNDIQEKDNIILTYIRMQIQ